MKSSNRANFVVLTYKMVLVILSIVLMTSSIIVLVSYSAFKEQFNSSIVYQTLSKHKAESLYYLMSQENHHFSTAFDKNYSPQVFLLHCSSYQQVFEQKTREACLVQNFLDSVFTTPILSSPVKVQISQTSLENLHRR